MAPMAKKATRPSPPIRGVGILWEDCLAAEVCPLAVNTMCQGLVSKTNPQNIADSKNESATKVIMVNHGEFYSADSVKKDSSTACSVLQA